MISKQDALNVLIFGKLYYPAYKHYGKEVVVVCDFCNKSSLKVCIGLNQTWDLCMKCVEELAQSGDSSGTNMLQRLPFRIGSSQSHIPVTNMFQSSTGPDVITFMMDEPTRPWSQQEKPLARMLFNHTRPK